MLGGFGRKTESMNLVGSFRSVFSKLLLAALALGGLACSGDAEEENGEASPACVKITYYETDGTERADGACRDYPQACAGGDKGCGGDDQACRDALNALCEQGTRRSGCVSTSLDDRVTSVEMGCRRE